MKQVFITGTSRGLGKALAEQYLEQGDLVVGYSRKETIVHTNYTHIEVDLSNAESIKGIQLQLSPDADEYVLYNNAGMIGDIKHFQEWTFENLQHTMFLNAISPLWLTHLFAKLQCNPSQMKYVIHIGSGAANHPIDGWGQYCASKAALHMASEVIEKEIKMDLMHNFKQIALSPGVIDTNMQAQIRASDHEHFSQLTNFINYKHNNELYTAVEVAAKIIRNFSSLFKANEAVVYLRNFT